MHIPDGFLDVKTCIATATVSVSSIGYTVGRLKNTLKDQDIPKIGVISAFIFAAQMVNFPVGIGTSGHLVGATLATLLLGPLQAIIALTSVVAIQAFVFQDGGIMALGANLMNMAIIPVILTYFLNRILITKRYEKIKIVFLGWISVVSMAILVSIQLSLSGTYELGSVLAFMVFWHMIIGIGEGVITCVAYNFIRNFMGHNNLAKEVV